MTPSIGVTGVRPNRRRDSNCRRVSLSALNAGPLRDRSPVGSRGFPDALFYPFSFYSYRRLRQPRRPNEKPEIGTFIFPQVEGPMNRFFSILTGDFNAPPTNWIVNRLGFVEFEPYNWGKNGAPAERRERESHSSIIRWRFRRFQWILGF